MNDLLLGQRIRALRKNKGITQDGLAKALGITPQAVSKWERGLSFPELPQLPALADQLGSTIDALLREEKTPAAEAASVAAEANETVQDSRILQGQYLQQLYSACIQEGEREFASGRYDLALMAYTKGLRGLESFLTPGEDGLSAYPWQEMLPLHWKLYLYRAVCYQHLGRTEDSTREIELAGEIWSLTQPDSVSADEFSTLLLQLGLPVI